MSELASDPTKGHGRTDIEQRDVRALTECMTVLPKGGDVYEVVSQSGSSYRVDALEGRCTCPDAKHNLDDDEKCKHERRVRFATGQWSIPAWVDVEAIDDHLGEHVAGGLSVARESAQVVTDGGLETVETEPRGNDHPNEDTSERPSDCVCEDWNSDVGLPCWPCYRDGFEEPVSE